jgi:hypothetical protein
LFDSELNSIGIFSGETTGVGTVPIAVPLMRQSTNAETPGAGVLSNVRGAQFTWDNDGKIEAILHGIAINLPPVLDKTRPTLRVAAPARASVVTRAPRVVLRGTASDNVAPIRVQFRLRAPGRRSYGAWRPARLANGNAKTKAWSCVATTNVRGPWAVQLRALDARGNSSAIRTILIIRR